METILFLATTEADGSLAKAHSESLSAALELARNFGGAKLMAGLVGENTAPALRQMAACQAQRFLTVTGPDFGIPRYATDAAAVEALLQAAQPTMVIAAATSRWNRVLPGVAQRVNGRADTHINQLTVEQTTLSITRWYYKQRIEASLRRAHRPWILLMEPGCYPAWSGASGEASGEEVAVKMASPSRTVLLGVKSPSADEQTIRPEADVLFVAGAGWTKKQADGQPHVPEAERLIREFLRVGRASLGSSKSLVDLGSEGQAVLSFLSHLNQVGQTGSTPRHAKGLATCCHGEEPHTVGWRFIRERRAVNLDPNCGWSRGKADKVYVADAFAVMERVNQLLAQSAGGS